jgi:hypothetical protein
MNKMKSYFQPSEVDCSDGCGATITSHLLELINAFREGYGHPMVVISGARCLAVNTYWKGAKKSAHMEGRAIDVARTPELLLFCTEENLEKYGLWMEHPDSTPQWLHLSCRPYSSWRPGLTRIFKP